MRNRSFTRSKFVIAATASLFAGLGTAASANIVVGLAPGSALLSSNDTAGQTVVFSPGAPDANNSVQIATPTTDAQRAAGLTMNLTITPTAADLTGTRLLMEIGGSANGTGFFLVNGVPTLVSKQASNANVVPNSANDTDLADNTLTLQHNGPALQAGSTYTVGAILRFRGDGTAASPYQDASATLAVDASNNGSAVSVTDFVLTDATTNGINWSGNRTVSVKTKTTGAGTNTNPNIGYLGGTHEDATAVTPNGLAFFAGTRDTNIDGVQDFQGATADGYLWNQTGSVPEPGALGVLGVAAVLAVRRRR
jgi:MYXO-CTERM domain-containing protein